MSSRFALLASAKFRRARASGGSYILSRNVRHYVSHCFDRQRSPSSRASALHNRRLGTHGNVLGKPHNQSQAVHRDRHDFGDFRHFLDDRPHLRQRTGKQRGPSADAFPAGARGSLARSIPLDRRGRYRGVLRHGSQSGELGRVSARLQNRPRYSEIRTPNAGERRKHTA
jgi:hypothetical protein